MRKRATHVFKRLVPLQTVCAVTDNSHIPRNIARARYDAIERRRIRASAIRPVQLDPKHRTILWEIHILACDLEWYCFPLGSLPCAIEELFLRIAEPSKAEVISHIDTVAFWTAGPLRGLAMNGTTVEKGTIVGHTQLHRTDYELVLNINIGSKLQ